MQLNPRIEGTEVLRKTLVDRVVREITAVTVKERGRDIVERELKSVTLAMGGRINGGGGLLD